MMPLKEPFTNISRRIGLRRAHLASTRLFVERHGLAAFVRARRRDRGRVLCYHSVGQPVMGVNDVTPAQFRRHIEIALMAGFQFVPAAKIARDGGLPNELAVTFDDAFKSVRTQAAPILADYGIPWSVFVISDWAEQSDAFAIDHALGWRELHDLASRGAELGSHSVSHPDFAKLEPSRISEELEGSKHIFEQRLGFAPRAFAIPFGQSNNWSEAAGAAARTVGYEFVYAQAEDTRPPGTVARTFVTKFDDDRIFTALLHGAYDRWEEWF